jgi:hypothetical protein
MQEFRHKRINRRSLPDGMALTSGADRLNRVVELARLIDSDS